MLHVIHMSQVCDSQTFIFLGKMKDIKSMLWDVEINTSNPLNIKTSNNSRQRLSKNDQNGFNLHPAASAIGRLQCFLPPIVSPEAWALCGLRCQLLRLYSDLPRVSQSLWEWREMLSLQLSRVRGGGPPLLPLQHRAVRHQQSALWRGLWSLENGLDGRVCGAEHLHQGQENYHQNVRGRGKLSSLTESLTCYSWCSFIGGMKSHEKVRE